MSFLSNKDWLSRLFKVLTLSIVLLFQLVANAQSIQSQFPYTRFEELEAISFNKTHKIDSYKRQFVIKISNQEEFDTLNETLNKALKDGEENIRIILPPQILFYKENHLFLNRVNYPNTSISIEGNKTILAGKSVLSYTMRGREQVINYLKKRNSLWSPLQQLDNPIEVLEKETTLCRIPNKLSLQMLPGLKIELSEWYCRKIYDIVDIDKEYIYFNAVGMTYREDWKTFSVNMDYALAKQSPRYRIKYPDSEQSEYPSRFLWVYASDIKSVTLSNVHFIGSNTTQESLLYISYSTCGKFEVSNCRFEYLGNEAIRCVHTANLFFHDNEVADCEAGVLLADNASPDACVENNRFIRTGLNGNMNYAVTCYGSDFLITDNLFQDFNYAAINSGIRLNWNKAYPCNGIIENNELCYTKDFIKNKWEYTLIDGGAIYLDSYIDHIIVRYNFIHDYSGMASNRGIYLDDGAGNVDIYGNVLVNILNGHAIFSWLSKGAGKKYPSANNNINCMYNIIQGSYKFDEI